MIDVRTATRDDIEAMGLVQAKGWERAFKGIVPHELTPSADELAERLRQRFGDPGREAAIAELGGELCGFCLFGPTRDTEGSTETAEIYVLFVAPETWRRGVGTALFEYALRRLAKKGFQKLALWSAAENVRANAFYERLGFVPDGAEQTRHDFGEIKEIRYRRALQPPP